MRRRRYRLRLLKVPAVMTVAVVGAACIGATADEPSAHVTVAMEDCKASRPARITGFAGALGMLFFGPPRERLVKRGTLRQGEESYTLYLPKAKTYSIKNSAAGDNHHENTSTLISVDQNGDGELAGEEAWFANLPLRLGDKMYDVTDIADDGSRIVLRPSNGPLRGVVVGRSCPPFSFKTADGKQVTLDAFAGKAVILDIWSVT